MNAETLDRARASSVRAGWCIRRAGTSKFVDVTTVDVGGLVTIDGADRGERVRLVLDPTFRFSG